jgi:dTDP-4-amino-4,6-dideoxygalactose transaminase
MRRPEVARDDPHLAINGGTALFDGPMTLPSLIDLEWVAAGMDELVRSGQTFVWYGGAQQQRFESTFSTLVGAKCGVMCNSGTSALQLLLRAAGAGPGVVVALPTFTFHAVLSAVLASGATPFLHALDPDTLVLDVDLAIAETPPGAIVVVVHTAGRAVDVRRLIAARPDLLIIEDSADAQATTFEGRQVGGDGIGAAWSFTTSHNEVHTAGVAGMVTTNDESLVARIRQLAHYGKPDQSWHPGTPLNPEPSEPGFNCMTTEIEALYGNATANIAEEAWKRRRQVGTKLAAALAATPVRIPPDPAGGEQNFYDVLFGVERSWSAHRDWALDALIAEGCSAWTYHSLLALDWLPERLRAIGAWTSREDELRAVDPGQREAWFGIRPNLTDVGIERATRSVNKVFAGQW